MLLELLIWAAILMASIGVIAGAALLVLLSYGATSQRLASSLEHGPGGAAASYPSVARPGPPLA